MSIFQTRADRATITARIADTDKQIASAEASLLAIMMQAAISDDGSADAATAKIASFQNKRKALDLALEQVEQDENDALDAAHAAEKLARVRACRQHSARLLKEGRAVTSALEALIAAQERLESTAGTLLAAAQKPDLKMRLGPSAIARAVQIEGHRLQGSRNEYFGEQTVRLFPRVPGTLGASDEDGRTLTLVARLTTLTNGIKQQAPSVLPPQATSEVEAAVIQSAAVSTNAPSIATEEGKHYTIDLTTHGKDQAA